MTARFPQRYGEHWRRTLIGVVMLVVTAMGVYWNATVAIVLGVVCLVLGGAHAIASVTPIRSDSEHTDQAWAEELLSRSLLAETLFTSFEFLAPVGVCLMITMPPELFLAGLPILFWSSAAAIATAFAMVVWERHAARKTLHPRSN